MNVLPKHSYSHTTKRSRRRKKGAREKKLGELIDSIESQVSGDQESRRIAIDHVEKLLAKWLIDMTKDEQENPWQRIRPTLITFGSYRLNAFHADADIDCLALCPPSCSREEFFASFVTILKNDQEVSQVHPIPSAYTPVIKLTVKDIQMDLLFARVTDQTKLLRNQQTRVSPIVASKLQREEYNIDDQDLLGQDEEGIRAINGARLSQILLDMVPNLNCYRKVLIAVKEWAKVHGIYSNSIGFLGGVNWAILVAWVCIQNPVGAPSTLFKLFFETFAPWQWPNPIMLQPLQIAPPPAIKFMQGWNPAVNPRDRHHLMPIITPTWPSMNSAYNVGMPQLRRIKEEMYRALKNINNSTQSAIFRPSPFFTEYNHFMQLSISANNEDSFVEWFRFVESKVRFLITSLETESVKAFPFGRFFERKYNSEGICVGSGVSEANYRHESCFFIGLRYLQNDESAGLHHLTSDFLHKVNSWSDRRDGMNVVLCHVTRERLPTFVWEEVDELSVESSVASDSSVQRPWPENSPNSPNIFSPTKKFRFVTTP